MSDIDQTDASYDFAHLTLEHLQALRIGQDEHLATTDRRLQEAQEAGDVDRIVTLELEIVSGWELCEQIDHEIARRTSL